ncbi:MAG: hypothetical protein HYS12_17375, partial [Planctomycetes bacterium]|nr:hypothetical protein [Planctomycetota bacterium]
TPLEVGALFLGESNESGFAHETSPGAKRGQSRPSRYNRHYFWRRPLVANLTIGREDFEEVPILHDPGGWGSANRIFDGQLEDLLRTLNEAIAA